MPRQAFLLVALEGFPETDAARILDVDVVTLRSLIEESGRELAAEIATDVLIIEDETFIAMELESLVESLGHRVLGVARTHSEALALTKNKKPGLILADIQLADNSSGLDAVNELLQIVRGAGDLHHRLSGALPHRRAAGAGVPDRQAVPAVDGIGDREPGAVLRAQRQAARAPGDRLIKVSDVDSKTRREAAAFRGFSFVDRAGVALVAAAGQSDQQADADGDAEHHQRAALDFARNPAQRLAAQLRRFVAEAGRVLSEPRGFADTARAAAEPVDEIAERRNQRVAHAIGRLRGAGEPLAAVREATLPRRSSRCSRSCIRRSISANSRA